MPSPRKLTSKKSLSHSGGVVAAPASLFLPFLGLSLFLWFSYRSLFSFPVWFDESVGKALFFGLPVWFYIMISGTKQIVETLAWPRFRRGLWLGLAIGGLFGFVAAILAAWQKTGQIQPAGVFMTDQFWKQFVLALMTAFWETLFFFSFVQTVIQAKLKHWSWLNQALVVAGIFLVFHLPNTILRFSGVAIMQQAVLLFFFAIGQALLFTREKNAYALILSHAIWGMVLLLHF
ncbi:MAG TPA: hypothetical protein DEP87_02060 [Candidatus Pacebacteria bacterium]|nr:hypothetical protein [Candidatus Paceibacterota bacterium]